MHGKFHVTVLVCQDVIIVCSKVVKELAHLGKSVCGRFCGLRCDGTEWEKQSAVDSTAIE